MGQKRTDQSPMISEAGSEFVLKLYNAIRSLACAEHDISVLRRSLGDLLIEESKFGIEIGGDRFWLNDHRIEMRSGHMVHRILLSEFRKRRIGRVEFSELPKTCDLEEFLRCFMGLADGGQSDGGTLQRILEEKEIRSVRVESPKARADAGELALSYRKIAHYTRVYFYAIQLVKGLFSQAEKGVSLDLSLAMQVTRTLVSAYVTAPATVLGLGTIKTSREFLANHAVNVAIYAIALGHHMGLPNRFLVDLGLTGLLHDVGESRLTRTERTGPGDLTDAAWEEAQKHPVLGVKIVLDAKGLDRKTLGRLVAGIFTHHLRHDLSGFPRLSHKQKVPLVGGIISLADFYDVAARPYGKNRFPCFSDSLLELIVDRCGKDFDPVLTTYFLRISGTFPVGTLCRLDTGELGIVCSLMEEGTPGDRPWVRLLLPVNNGFRSGDLINLNSVDQENGKYRRRIVEILNPNDFGIDVSEYLIEF